MSLRPSTSTSVFSAPAPPAPASPTREVESRHRAQLASYKRDPTKAAAAARLASLHSAWGGPSSSAAAASLSLQPGTEAGNGRRLSAIVEDGLDHDAKKYRRPRHVLLRALRSLSPKHQRIGVYLLLALTSYLLILRPLLSSTTSSPQPGSASASPKPHSAPSRLPMHADPPLYQHSAMSLPVAVQHRAVPDHPVKNGILLVDPESKFHPIYQLIRDGRAAWEAKNKRQSKTLLDAVKEYRRRYGRQPPKGFDRWWEYVVMNNVTLPDEYDQIHRDLLPYRALSPATLNKRIDEASTLPDTYTLRIKSGSLRTSVTYDADAIYGADERLAGQADLLRPVAKWLPDMKIIYSVHDTARYLLGWGHRQELEERVEEGDYLDPNEEIDTTPHGFSAACPPRSPLRISDRLSGASRGQPPLLPVTSLPSKSFISSHSSTFDICSHPELVPLHGALSTHSPHVDALIPVFSLSKTHLHSDVLGVPTEQWTEAFEVPEWKTRTHERLLWRGSNTGSYFTGEDGSWRASHRARLVWMANEGLAGAGQTIEEGSESLTLLPPPRQGGKIREGAKLAQWGEANEEWMDLAFTDQPIQCNEEDGTCRALAEEFPFKEKMTHDGALDYKYVVDVDGNAWSARFKRLLTSGSLIFKSTIMPEWWTDRIQPWVHYVPIKLDYSDLYDAVSFFRGDLSGKNGEPLLAEEIARTGREWSLAHWRKEDMRAYVFRLYLEWGRLVADRRGEMDFVYEPGMELQRF